MGFQVLDYEWKTEKLVIMWIRHIPTFGHNESTGAGGRCKDTDAAVQCEICDDYCGRQSVYRQCGELVGWMNAEQFINNDGNEINTYELVKVKLYYANADGD